MKTPPASLSEPADQIRSYLASRKAVEEKATKGPWFDHPEHGPCSGDPNEDSRSYPIDEPGDNDFIVDSRNEIGRMRLAMSEMVRCLEENIELGDDRDHVAICERGLSKAAAILGGGE